MRSWKKLRMAFIDLTLLPANLYRLVRIPIRKAFAAHDKVRMPIFMAFDDMCRLGNLSSLATNRCRQPQRKKSRDAHAEEALRRTKIDSNGARVTSRSFPRPPKSEVGEPTTIRLGIYCTSQMAVRGSPRNICRRLKTVTSRFSCAPN